MNRRRPQRPKRPKQSTIVGRTRAFRRVVRCTGEMLRALEAYAKVLPPAESEEFTKHVQLAELRRIFDRLPSLELAANLPTLSLSLSSVDELDRALGGFEPDARRPLEREITNLRKAWGIQ